MVEVRINHMKIGDVSGPKNVFNCKVTSIQSSKHFYAVNHPHANDPLVWAEVVYSNSGRSHTNIPEIPELSEEQRFQLETIWSAHVSLEIVEKVQNAVKHMIENNEPPGTVTIRFE